MITTLDLLSFITYSSLFIASTYFGLSFFFFMKMLKEKFNHQIQSSYKTFKSATQTAGRYQEAANIMFNDSVDRYNNQIPSSLRELGFKEIPTTKELKTRYRELAKEHHPDKEGGSAEKFKHVTSLYKESLKYVKE